VVHDGANAYTVVAVPSSSLKAGMTILIPVEGMSIRW
jgi:hypothetical protein